MGPSSQVTKGKNHITHCILVAVEVKTGNINIKLNVVRCATVCSLQTDYYIQIPPEPHRDSGGYYTDSNHLVKTFTVADLLISARSLLA